MSGMSIVGALPPPLGVNPNFENPQGSLRKYNIITYSLAVPLTTIFVAIRMYTKVYIIHTVHPEDYMAVAAWLFALGYSGIGIATLSFGAGDHQWDVPESKIITLRKLFFANELWYGLTVYTTKLALLFLYCRIFRPARLMVWSSKILIGLMTFYLVSDIAEVFICNPIHKYWDYTVPGHCSDLYALFVTNAVFSIVTDFWILLSPMPVIWHLQMAVKRKFAVTVIFTAGLLACITGIIRAKVTVQYASSSDLTYVANLFNLWSLPEVFVGIICACLPVIPAFFQHFQRKRQDSLYTGKNSAQNTHPSTLKGFELEQTILIPPLYGPNFENTIEGGFRTESRDFGEGLELEGIIRTVEVWQW